MLDKQSVSAGTVTFKYYKQNDSTTKETQVVSYGNFSCPKPTSVPTPIIVSPTNTLTQTPPSNPTATPVPTSTDTHTSTGNTGVTNTPVPTQKPTNNQTHDNEHNKPFFLQTNNNDQSDEKEEKNKGNKQTNSVISHTATTKAKKPTSAGGFIIQNIFGGFYSFWNSFKSFYSKS